MSNVTAFGLSFLMIVLVVLSSCRKDDIFLGEDPNISISLDTLTFDTVFTQVGSATRFLKIYNNEPQDITVSVRIEKPQTTFFRLNVDGIAGTEVKDVRVGGNDSIYIFADVKIDPDQPVSVSPFIIEEQLIITTSGGEQNVLLEAWGQNANYIPGKRQKGQQYRFSCNQMQEVWDDPKPYVIYGIMLLDSCELVLPAGTDVYVHGGVVVNDDLVYSDGFILVTNTGKITANGTVSSPVTFQGDRLEMSFDDRAGQWVGIRLLTGSVGNRLEHTFIKNSIVGLRADSLAQVSFVSCEIKNTTASGLIGVNASITADNLLIHSNGQNAVTLAQGGIYDFRYCTFASYGNQAPALSMNNYLIYPVEDADDILVVNPLNVTFTNSIVTGNDQDEISLEDATDGEAGFFNYQLDHCIVSVDELLDAAVFPDFFDNCNNCLQSRFGDILFVDTDLPDYHLDTLSIAEERALPLPNIFDDLDGNDRDGTSPDVGCYEYQY